MRFINKSVHLEAVYNLSENGLSRLEENSKHCSVIAEQIILGARHISRTWTTKPIGRYVEEEGIKWKTNAPSSSHFGGLWETAVKTIKFCMKRAIGL